MVKKYCVLICIVTIGGCAPLDPVKQDLVTEHPELDELSRVKSRTSLGCLEKSFSFVQEQEQGVELKHWEILSEKLLEKGYGTGRLQIALTLDEKAALLKEAGNIEGEQLDILIPRYETCMVKEMEEFYHTQERPFPEKPATSNGLWGTAIHSASGKKVAHQTAQKGTLKTYQVCATIPDNGFMMKESVKTQVIIGVSPGEGGDWEQGYSYTEMGKYGPTKVCRGFDHQLHDQDRLLLISVDYKITI